MTGRSGYCCSPSSLQGDHLQLAPNRRTAILEQDKRATPPLPDRSTARTTRWRLCAATSALVGELKRRGHAGLWWCLLSRLRDTAKVRSGEGSPLWQSGTALDRRRVRCHVRLGRAPLGGAACEAFPGGRGVRVGRSRPVLINFLAHWYTVCEAEMPGRAPPCHRAATGPGAAARSAGAPGRGQPPGCGPAIGTRSITVFASRFNGRLGL